MDEIKPVAWRARFKNAPELGDWFSAEPIDGDLNETEPLYDQKAIDTMRDEVERLRAKTACTMGVGAGDGQLFVHGNYDSIKAAQGLVFRAERAEADALRKDAERYRWVAHLGSCPYAETDQVWESKESLDAAIDAAKQAAE